jgi:hypothetical protein
MAFLRSMYINVYETHHEIAGKLSIHTMESVNGSLDDRTIDLTFYRPGSAVAEADWLKDVLVQVIEQL